MRRLRTLVGSTARWAIALGLIVFLLVLAQAAVGELGRERHLGLGAQIRDGAFVIDRVQPGGWGWDAKLRPGDVVLSVNGQPVSPVTDPTTIRTARTVEVRTATGDVRAADPGPGPLPATPLHQASFFLMAFALVGVGATVFVVARDIGPAVALLTLSTSAAAMFEASLGQTSGAEWAFVLTFVALLGFGGATLTLFLLFPVNRTLSRSGRGVVRGALLLHVILIACYLWIVAFDTAAYDVFQKAAVAVLVLDFLGAIGLLIAALVQRRRYPELRQNLQSVTVGAIVSFAPFALLSLAPYLMGLGYLVQPDVSILSLVLLPASIGGALLSRQFMGATRLLRRGMIALGVWVVLLAAYSLLWNLVDRTLVQVDPAHVFDSALLSIVAIAATFPFAQHWLRRWIEQALFRDVYDYAPTLRAISEELVHIAKVEPIARHVLSRLSATLDLTWAAIVLDRHGEQREYSWGEIGMTDVRRIPLVVEGREIGELHVGPKRQDIELLPEDLSLLETVAPMAATALENALLLEQLEEQVRILTERDEQLTALSTRLMEAQEEERARLALDLHDDPLQRAVFLSRQLLDGNGNRHQNTADWRREAEDIVQSLRAICAGLRPPTLDDFGLVAGLEWLLDELGARAEIAGSLEVKTFNGEQFGRLPSDLELALYRVGQEALNNCVKHSHAANVNLTLEREPEDIRLRVRDDGEGYDVGGPYRETSRVHLGIMGMNERLRPWHGSVRVESQPGQGTTVIARVPAESLSDERN